VPAEYAAFVAVLEGALSVFFLSLAIRVYMGQAIGVYLINLGAAFPHGY
jgi:hypothetical protein